MEKIKTNNLNYLIDPTLVKSIDYLKVNRSFKNEDDRASFSKYYTSAVEIKYCNAAIDGKSFFDVPIKHKEETYENIIEMGRNNDYTTDNLLDKEYFSNNYKLIAIDLGKQIELEDAELMQQNNFIGILERNEGSAMFFVIEKTENTTFHFLQNVVSIK